LGVKIKAPEKFETERLVIRRPVASDAEAIFTRYASDREVTRFVGWRAHESVAETRAFVTFSDEEWERWPAGPYLVESRPDATLLGGTGLTFETPERAMTGYIFARDAWGNGYATEALHAMVDTARAVGVRQLYALCHTDHHPSWRVLEKCGFTRDATLTKYVEFPNLCPGDPCDVFRYVRVP
jgi:RimJ/RimL family protein N-acetyltransferase